ncbi:hypothetical protein DRJ16_02125 [Candidatus Woesearchaeota archaeon]|nr:MAG: hypothetical protein DRJ16_02125 [Candidatus Woesearchaeota archaeon]
MKSIGFDAGPIISLATNNLLWLLEPLKKKFGGKFFITPAVKRELIDKPFETKRYEFEAFQVAKLIADGVLEVVKNAKIFRLRDKLLDLANHSFKIGNDWLRIVHEGEVEVLAADAVLNADATVVDERTVRMFLEAPERLATLFEQRIHEKVYVNWDNVEEFRNYLKDVDIIRSTELVTIAYELGLLDKFVTSVAGYGKRRVLDAALWALKVRGCAISKKEIDRIVEGE